MRRDGWKPYLIAFAIVVAAGCSRSVSLEGITDPVERGAILYRESCQTCHAPDGTGVSGLGNSMVDNEFTQSHPDEELIAEDRCFALRYIPGKPGAEEHGLAVPPLRQGAYGYWDDHPLAIRRWGEKADYLAARAEALWAQAPKLRLFLAAHMWELHLQY